MMPLQVWLSFNKDININNIIDVILKKDFIENTLDRCESNDITLYRSEIDYLLIIKNEEVRKILYLLLVISKWSNHPSGWIKYDRKYLFDFWDMGKYKESKKVELINECCRSGLELRVIGSKHPVACFRVNFRTFDSEQIVILKDNEDIKPKAPAKKQPRKNSRKSAKKEESDSDDDDEVSELKIKDN